MPTTANDEERFAARRSEMVEQQLMARGISDARVLGAMALIPRHRFVEPSLREVAYEDRPLPIGHGQTISQPYMVARATELCAPQPGDRAFEVGTGCGYQLAVLAHLCAKAFGAELLPDLAERAARALREQGIDNAVVEAFDGGAGWPDEAPFDVIVVSAGAPRIPPLLVDQLADGGRLVIPVGSGDKQELALVRRRGDTYSVTNDTKCRYVDLLGRYGFGQNPPLA